jgi:hypothetical protein
MSSGDYSTVLLGLCIVLVVAAVCLWFYYTMQIDTIAAAAVAAAQDAANAQVRAVQSQKEADEANKTASIAREVANLNASDKQALYAALDAQKIAADKAKDAAIDAARVEQLAICATDKANALVDALADEKRRLEAKLVTDKTAADDAQTRAVNAAITALKAENLAIKNREVAEAIAQAKLEQYNLDLAAARSQSQLEIDNALVNQAALLNSQCTTQTNIDLQNKTNEMTATCNTSLTNQKNSLVASLTTQINNAVTSAKAAQLTTDKSIIYSAAGGFERIQIKARNSGRCLKIPAGRAMTDNNNSSDCWAACNQSDPDQVFYYDVRTNTIRKVSDGKCLDDGGGSNFSFRDCSAMGTNGSQTFVYNDYWQMFMNGYSWRCTDNNFSKGLYYNGCNGNSNQKFDVVRF